MVFAQNKIILPFLEQSRADNVLQTSAESELEFKRERISDRKEREIFRELFSSDFQ